MSAEPSRKCKSGKNKKSKPMEKTEVNEEDGLKRMVQMSTIFQSPGFPNEKKKRKADVLTAPKKKQQKTEETSKSIQHMTKIGPYDPKVYAMVEEIRAETEETEKAIQSMTPAEEGEIVEAELELSSNHFRSPSKVDQMVCPFHLERLVPVPNAKGYNLMKCATQPCLISVVGQDQAETYMKEVYKQLHPDIYDRWGELLCFCGFLPALRQSHSAKNPERMYLCCHHKPTNRCRFFRWADEPIQEQKDPLNIYQWLMHDLPPAPPPAKYSENLADFEKRQETVAFDTTWEKPKTLRTPC